MPAINPILQKEQRRRSRILAGFTVSLTVLFAGIEILWMFAYHISLYISVPIILITSLLQILATGGLVTQFIGFYMALKPIEKDPFNPINKAIDIKENTRIAVTMPIYHEDARRVAGAFSAMIEELSHYKEAKHFDWFILSDSRKEDVIVQEQKAVFLLKEKFPEIGIHYRHHIMNTFAKVGNTSDFFRRWGGRNLRLLSCSMGIVLCLPRPWSHLLVL
ncbi:MAG: hypothetical protein IJ934_03060 [Acetobacter sp.]|nr:hypothetical protein [Acetobacter sp.]